MVKQLILKPYTFRVGTWAAWTWTTCINTTESVRWWSAPRKCSIHAKQIGFNSKQTCAQSYCTSGYLYFVLLTDCTGLSSNRLLHTACACAVGAFVAYSQKIRGMRMCTQGFRAHPRMTIFTSRGP